MAAVQHPGRMTDGACGPVPVRAAVLRTGHADGAGVDWSAVPVPGVSAWLPLFAVPLRSPRSGLV